MSLNKLFQNLYIYNESELFYKNYYFAKQNPESLKLFIDNLDEDYIVNNNLIIPYIYNEKIPQLMKDETYFECNSKDNVILIKHNRYTPQFVHEHIFFEMIYVLSGKCHQVINHHNVHMKEGDICIVSSGVKHSIGVFDDSIIINVLIRRSTFEDAFFDFLRNNNLLSSFFLNSIYKDKQNDYILFHTNNDKSIEISILEMLSEYNEQDRYYNNILNHLIMVFFAKLLRDYEDSIEVPNVTKKGTLNHTNILTYIQDNYVDITLEELANKFHFSIPYCSKIIKEIAGCNFTQLLQRIRLERAESLLMNTNIPIADISNNVGYPNVEHFIRLFNKKYNMSPSKYRKNTTKV
ncbi:transcriptional regulator AraC family [Clostridioides difficile]|nr:transcriptional regulator AraC family [Clostridioides difficile]